MKKIVSLLLVMSMIVGLFIFTSSASLVNKTEAGNVSIQANYFGGTVDFDYLYGSASLAPSRKTYYDTERVKDGDPSKGYIKIDGVLDEGEWGAPVATISSKYAANNININGDPLKDRTNEIYDSPSAENSYYYNTGHGSPEGMEYDVYVMWDEDYLYVAIRTDDKDGPKQLYSGEQSWDGDCFQMRVDTRGVNTSTEDGVFDATNVYTYTDDNNVKRTIYPTPWADTENTGVKLLHDSVNNLMFTYTSSAGGYTECYDAAIRYFPTETEYTYTNAAGEEITAVNTSYSGASIADDTEVEAYMDNYCYAVARWDNWGTAKERQDTAVYEIAVPWIILQAEGTEYNPVAGDILGMSMVLLDGTKVNSPLGTCPDGYTSWLAWGSGICGSQISNDPLTTAGTNALVLSSTGYKDVPACEHDFAEATCLSPETCKNCGYQRGFASGHVYTYSELVLPKNGNNGHVTGTCTVCGEETTTPIDNDTNASFASFKTTDTNFSTLFQNGYTVNWFDSTDTDNCKMLFNANGKSKTSFDNTTFGYAVSDCATKGDGLYYANGELATLSSSISSFDSQTGTYFFIPAFNKTSAMTDNSYAFSQEIYFPNRDYSDQINITKALVYQFGGKDGIKYVAGLFIVDNGTRFVFAIGEDAAISRFPVSNESGDMTFEDLTSRAIVYKEVSESEVSTEEWHAYTFIYDSDNGVAAIFWNNQLQVVSTDNHLKDGMKYFTILRRHHIPFYAKNIEVSSISYAAENYNLKANLSGAETYTVTVDGVETSYEAGATVTLETAAFKAATAERFAGWTGDTDVLTENKASTTFTMPSKNVVLTSSYIKVGDANGDGKINAADANYIAQIIVGSLASVNAADINADGKVNAGDSNLLTKMITGTYSPIE